MDTVVLFSRGKTEDKLRIIFDMCDNDRNGVIDKGELSEMLRSLVEIARTTSLSDQHVTDLIDGMFQVFYLQLFISCLLRLNLSSKIKCKILNEMVKNISQEVGSLWLGLGLWSYIAILFLKHSSS